MRLKVEKQNGDIRFIYKLGPDYNSIIYQVMVGTHLPLNSIIATEVMSLCYNLKTTDNLNLVPRNYLG